MDGGVSWTLAVNDSMNLAISPSALLDKTSRSWAATYL